MFDLSQRCLLPELMDQADLAPAEHRRALAALARINRLSLSAESFWPAILQAARETKRPLRVLDVASGGGDVCIRLWHKAQRAGVRLEIVGVDVSEVAIQFARQKAEQAGAAIHFAACDVLHDLLPDHFDAVLSSLFLHHLTADAVVALLAKMGAAATQVLLINDLRRSHRGYLLAHVVCQVMTRSHVVHVDGPRSVAGAFSEQEMSQLFQQAGLTDVRIRRCWPFRMLAEWRPNA